MTLTHAARGRLHQALEALEFQRRDGNTYRRNGVLARSHRGWLSIESTARGGLDPLGAGGQRPGLWKLVAARSDEVPRWEFHLPLSSLDGEWDAAELDDEGESAAPFQAVIHWALATAGGTLPTGWEPPERAVLEGSIPDGGLSVQTGPFVRQGSLIREADRLALAFPLVHELPAELSEARRGWLRRVLLDAQSRWYMVRIVENPAGTSPAVQAQVDLSGVPHAIVEELLPFSLDALRWVVPGLLWPVGFLSDPAVRCQAWEMAPTDLFKHCSRRRESHE